jgi:RNA polymerase sigma-70 factor (sigma-E family)
VRADGEGMADLYARHVPAGLRLAYLLTGDRSQAEDLTHDAFVRCVGRFSHLRAHQAFDAYLRRAIVNLHTSRLRRLRLERRTIEHEGHRAGGLTASMPDVAERDEVWRALASLPARQRAALVLRFYEDLSERDTASVLGCSLAAVKSLVARGSGALRDVLSQRVEGEDR